ncbi:FAD-dependent monooxygenase [Rhizobium sp. Root1220]|uniref:FAD-dependent monooxygenase n=1 Tax=Rhizobium sp. Root1220 TaxID=1736432 RepID=UPI001FCDCF71|nr:FAD-dependent monooxygenase [Rhizobium sp. Root1220]
MAGNALAWWLVKRGFTVTVVERHPEFRDGGQNIDVRGAGRTVLAMMGLEQVVAEGGTGETGVRFVDSDDKPIAQFDVQELGSDGPTAELEILRGDLARIFYVACDGDVRFRFDDCIIDITDAGEAVHVSFKSGARDEYDLVVIAEGVGSSTRELVFSGELREHFADAGWETQRVLQGLETTDDLYFDVLRQVKLDRWSNGRVVLTGDAAWCATPIAGIGTTLAIVGAYVLAGELSRSTDLAVALRRYDEIMRPYVEKGQNVPKFAPKMLQPQTMFGVALQRAVLRVVDKPGIKQLATKLFVSGDDDFEVPAYDDVRS